MGSMRSARGVRQLLSFGIEPLQVRTDLIRDLRQRCYDQIGD